MNTLTKYGIGIVALILAFLIFSNRMQKNKIDKLKIEKDQIESNINQLYADNANQAMIILTKDEWLRIYDDSISKLLKSLAIKPQTVIRYVERVIIERDTVDHPVFVNQIGTEVWAIADTGQCFIWQGEAYFWNNQMNVNRTNFEYHNKITEVAYKQLKWKFWFIRVYDRQHINLRSIAECGGETVRAIEIRK